MTTNNRRNFFQTGSILLTLWATTAAFACINLFSPPIGTTEWAPCGGVCNSYVVCPPDETCPGGDRTGYHFCTPTPFVVSCLLFSGGITANGACCTGGSDTGMTSPTVTRTKQYQTPGGLCTTYIFGEPGPAN